MSKGYAAGHVGVDSLDDKGLFLDFWKIPFTTDARSQPTVSIVTGKDLRTEYRNALVLLQGDGEPQLCHLNNKIHIFAKVRRISNYPPGLEVISPVLDKEENIISFILKDCGRKVIYLPFALDEVLEGFYYERYLSGRGGTFLPRPLLNLYYWAKPAVPRLVQARLRASLAKLQRRRRFPQWPFEPSLEEYKRFVMKLLLSISKDGSLPFIWFWPGGKESCLILTHDVESSLEGNGGIFRLISREQELGFKSSFNVVPFKYKIDENVMNRIRSLGCEIGVHGYSHDGKLFSSWEVFKERLSKIGQIAQDWKAAGFRSASTYRNPAWVGQMNFEYDSSFFDTDPYEPQPGGCLSLYPYFLGDVVEIPMTIPQDYTLFTILREESARIWERKAELIKQRNGIICANTHPDEGYMGDEDKEQYYVKLLEHLSGDVSLWNPLPVELARWWRKRRAAQIVSEGSELRIENGTSEMCIRWAKLVDGQLWLEES